jgi:hypothetical protein
VDHPGTPVEVLGTLILVLTYPFTGGNQDQFVSYHLQNPSLFLVTARSLVTFASLLSVVLIARYALPIRDWKDVALSIAISVSYFAIHPHDEQIIAYDSFVSVSVWSHNSFNLPFGTVLLLALLVLLRSENEPSRRKAIVLGFAAGILTAIQLYFAVWVICIAVAFYMFGALTNHTLRQTLVTGAMVVLSSLIGFAVATIPVFPRYNVFLGWVWQLINAQGLYGTGARGFTSVESLTANFDNLLREAPHVIVTTGIVVAILGYILFVQARKTNNWRGMWACGFGLLIHTLLLALFILKHAQPVYLVAISATMPILLAVIFSDLSQGMRLLKHMRPLLALVIMMVFLVNFMRAISFHHERINRVAEFDATVQLAMDNYAGAIGTTPESLRVYWAYPANSRCMGLWFGNEYADRAFSGELEQVCVNEQMFNVWPQGVVLGDRFVPLENGEWDILITNTNTLTDFMLSSVAGYTVNTLGANISIVTRKPFIPERLVD